VNRSYQLSQIARLDRIPAVLEVSDGTFGNARLAVEKLGGKLTSLLPDFVQIFLINDPLVLAARFVRGVENTRVTHHGKVGPTSPSRSCLFANVMKFSCHKMSAHEQTDCLAGTGAAVWSAKL